MAHPLGSTSHLSFWKVAFAGALLILSAGLTYRNAITVPFFFDDPGSIAKNPTIRSLAALKDVLSPPNDGTGVTGRPLVNLSLAINYHISGANVRGYHVTNILLHALAALALFGVTRRTLLLAPLRGRFGEGAFVLALSSALIWTVHPLQTESVTCVIQRTEILAGLFYLVTLYCFVRSVDSASPRFWQAAAIVSSLVGMSAKEIMVTAPFMVLLYDRTFVSGSFLAAWRRRPGFYASIGATLLLLGYLVFRIGGTRGDAAGFALGVPWWSYTLKQCEAVILYLKLAFWPHPLVLYYGTDVVTNPLEVWKEAVVLSGVLTATFFALWRKPVLGFIGAWFFAILAPSSSVVPLVTQTVSEHRMYLPLAAPITLGVLIPYILAKRILLRLALPLAAGLCLISIQRNVDYQTEVSIWTDTVAKAPGNYRAFVNLGGALKDAGKLPEALTAYRTALQIEPNYPEALVGVGAMLVALNKPSEAIAFCRQAAQLKPDLVEAHINLGRALSEVGSHAEGIAHLRTAVRLNPSGASAHDNLGAALLRAGEPAAAVASFRAAIRADPDYAPAYSNLGTAIQSADPRAAIQHFETALKLDSALVETRNNLANALRSIGDFEQAIVHYRAALALRPEYAEAQVNLASMLLELGRHDEAIVIFKKFIALSPASERIGFAYSGLADALARSGHSAEAIPFFEKALLTQGNDATIHFNLANTLLNLQRPTEAIEAYRKTILLNPKMAEAYLNLGNSFVQLGQVASAIENYEAALRVRPGYAAAKDNLEKARAFIEAGRPRN